MLMCSAMLACSVAQVWAEASGESAEDEAGDILGRETPRGALEGFLRAVDEVDYETAARYLDLRNLPKAIRQYEPEELALGFSIVLQRALWVDIDVLSDEPGGLAGDGLPSYRDELGRAPLHDREITLFLQRVPGENDTRIWKISNRTISQLPELYAAYRYPDYVEYLAETLPEASILGVELFKWVAGIIAGLMVLPVALFISWLTARIMAAPGTARHDRLWQFFSRPVTTFIVIWTIAYVMRHLGYGVTAQTISEARTLTIVLSTWILIALINMFRDFYVDFLEKSQRNSTIVLLRPITSAVKSIVVVIMLMVWLDNIGFNITTLIAGLGIGGIAVALVLQKPLEDVFGAFTLFQQQPVRIGDFCQIGSITGTVEEISLRTTRIRTPAGTVVSMPNAKLALETIDNISARKQILYRPSFKLGFKTTPEQLRRIIADIREMLESDDRVLRDRLRVNFLGFDEHGFAIEAFADIDTKAYPVYLAIAEELNLKIIDIIREAGANLDVPELQLRSDGEPIRTGLTAPDTLSTG